MTVQITSGGTMFQPDQVSIPHKLNRVGAVPQKYWLVEFLYKPAIVAIFVRIRGDLLLLGTDS